MIDPLSLIAGIVLLGSIAVTIITITIEVITEWFQSRGKIKTNDTDVIAFTLADRIANQKYVTVPGVFGSAPASTRMVQGFYNTRTGQVADARAMSSNRAPDARIVANHAAGNGLVIYE